MATNPIAEQLRRLADQFDTATAELPAMTISIDVQPHDHRAPEDARIAAIDTLAQAVFGRPAKTEQLVGGSFHHGAAGRVEGAEGLRLSLFTQVQDPETEDLRAENERLRAQLAATMLGDKPGDGHIYPCCGKVGRISPHASSCDVNKQTPTEASPDACPTCGSTRRSARLMTGCGLPCDDPRGWHVAHDQAATDA